VVANSLHAVRSLSESGIWTVEQLRAALQNDYEGADGLRRYLLSQSAFGNNATEVDELASTLVTEVSTRVRALRNDAGNAFLADWSTPSTHLLYGHLTGATPDGRKAREMLGYGVDPRVGTLTAGWSERTLSAWRLPYHQMNGGYASHVGLTLPQSMRARDMSEKGEWMRDEIVAPLFRLGSGVEESPYYVYFNVDDASHLREVLRDPEKYAPSGDIMRRLDLSAEAA